MSCAPFQCGKDLLGKYYEISNWKNAFASHFSLTKWSQYTRNYMDIKDEMPLAVLR